MPGSRLLGMTNFETQLWAMETYSVGIIVINTVPAKK